MGKSTRRKVKGASLVMFAALLQAACQTTAQYEARRAEAVRQTLLSYRGQTIADLLREQKAFSTRDYRRLSATRRIYRIETGPVVSTVFLPPYTPGAGSQSFGNLNAAANSVPGIARSTTLYCRIYVDAERIDQRALPDSWRIREIEFSGNTC
ncbi:hypothetical protein [Roseibium aggregatum]|uniref:hypothetical protein n=1 Tax=Roseibium aggregatum TaxID=187304 RepID=UPI001E34B715|nr:hypothetical protein [Roseibium aggregatum]UES46807.1 hypothetical protein GFK90_25220 [Roseibium aggregatum]